MSFYSCLGSQLKDGYLEPLKRDGQLDKISTLFAPLHISPLCISSGLPFNWSNDPRVIRCVVLKVIAHSVAMTFESFLHASDTTDTCLEAEE